MEAQLVVDYPLCRIRKHSSIQHRFGIRPAALQIRYTATASKAAVLFVWPHLHWRTLLSALRALHLFCHRGSDKYIHRELDSPAVFSLNLSGNSSSQTGASSWPAAPTASQLPSAAADPNVAPLRSGTSDESSLNRRCSRANSPPVVATALTGDLIRSKFPPLSSTPPSRLPLFLFPPRVSLCAGGACGRAVPRTLRGHAD